MFPCRKEPALGVFRDRRPILYVPNLRYRCDREGNKTARESPIRFAKDHPSRLKIDGAGKKTRLRLHKNDICQQPDQYPVFAAGTKAGMAK